MHPHSSLPTGRFSYDSQHSRRSPLAPQEQPKKRHHFLALFIVLVCAVLAGGGLWAKQSSAHALALSREKTAAIQKQEQAIASATNQINQLIANNAPITFSVSFQELDGSYPATAHEIGTSGTYDAASVGKLITAADYLHHVDEGKASLSQNIDGASAQDWLQMMIVNSDDTAWAELNGYLTHADLVSYANSIGIGDYDADNNLLSTHDVTMLYDQLWQGKLLKSSSSSLLLGYLQRANYREYIIPAVPSDDTVYHKVGLDNDEVNDAAIIRHGDQVISLTIFTDGNGTYDWTTRATLIQQITRLVLSAYFS